MSFSKDKYEVVRNAISQELISFIQISAEILESAYMAEYKKGLKNFFPFGDEQVKNSFANYSPNYSESLMVYLKPLMQEITGKDLHESYTYVRTYYNGAVLAKHTDRPSCEISATICLQKDETPWPIYFENLDSEIVEVDLNQGDMIIYSGIILPHWRNAYEGEKHRQIFTHYVDANGKYGKSHRYDGRKALSLRKS
jgi:hypothetical protein